MVDLNKPMNWQQFQNSAQGAKCHKDQSGAVVCEAVIDNQHVVCNVGKDGNGETSVTCKKAPDSPV